MEAACQRTADGLRFPLPRIPHAVVVMVVALDFHTEDPDGVGDALNIFLFPYLSPSEGLEADLLMWKWDAILGGDLLHPHRQTRVCEGSQGAAPQDRVPFPH